MKFLTLKLFFICIYLCTIPLNAQEIQVAAAAQAEIYVGEPFVYQIHLVNSNQAGTVETTALEGWSPSFEGQSSQTRIVNNQTTRKIIMNFSLTATKNGRQTIPSVPVKINNKTYHTNEVPITVLTPDATDRLGLKIKVSEKTAFVGQPIIVTIHWYIEASLANRLEKYSLNVPAFKENPAFLITDEPTEPVTGAKAAEIAINEVNNLAYQSTATYNNYNCLKVTAQRIIIPQFAGPHTFEAPKVVCVADMARQTGRSRGFFDPFDRQPKNLKRFIAEADPITITVKPLPREGRPPYFNGLVGRYKIKTEATPTKVHVGDPITLNITIEGDLLERVNMPDLAAIPGVTDHFKIAAEQASPKIDDRHKLFTQTIRAKNDQVGEIPPIPLTYFDVDQDKYITVSSEPIALEVAPTKVITLDQSIGGSTRKVSSEIEAVRQGVAANVYDQSKLLKNTSFSPAEALTSPAYLIISAGPFALFLCTGIWRIVTTDSPEKQLARQSSGAARKAMQNLNRLTSQSATIHEDMLEILRQYIGDRFNKAAQSLTQRDCRELLQAHCREPVMVDEFCGLFEQCENSRYAGSNAMRTVIDAEQVKTLIKNIEKHIKSSK